MWMRVDGKNQLVYAFDNMMNRAVVGTTDWTLYDVVLDVSALAVDVAYGVLLSNEGTAWLDGVSLDIVPFRCRPPGNPRQAPVAAPLTAAPRARCSSQAQRADRSARATEVPMSNSTFPAVGAYRARGGCRPDDERSPRWWGLPDGAGVLRQAGTGRDPGRGERRHHLLPAAGAEPPRGGTAGKPRGLELPRRADPGPARAGPRDRAARDDPRCLRFAVRGHWRSTRPPRPSSTSTSATPARPRRPRIGSTRRRSRRRSPSRTPSSKRRPGRGRGPGPAALGTWAARPRRPSRPAGPRRTARTARAWRPWTARARRPWTARPARTGGAGPGTGPGGAGPGGPHGPGGGPGAGAGAGPHGGPHGHAPVFSGGKYGGWGYCPSFPWWVGCPCAADLDWTSSVEDNPSWAAWWSDLRLWWSLGGC